MTQAAMQLVPDGITVAVVESHEEAAIAAVAGSQLLLLDAAETSGEPTITCRRIALAYKFNTGTQLAFTTPNISSEIGDGRDPPRALATAVGWELYSDISLVTASS